jgi:hypothetical protein
MSVKIRIKGHLMSGWLKIILASCTLLVLLLIAKMVSPNDQKASIVSLGLIPPAGKYAAKTSIFGTNIEGQMNFTHTNQTSGTFDFQMASPILFSCPPDNKFTVDNANQTVVYTLDQCTVDRLNQNNLTLKTMAYNSAQKVLKVDLIWKKVIPLSLLMTYQG